MIDTYFRSLFSTTTEFLLPSQRLFLPLWPFLFSLLLSSFSYHTFPLLGPINAILQYWYTCESLVSSAHHADLFKIFLFKQPLFDNPDELFSDLGAFYDLLSIGLNQSGDFVSELLIKSSKVSLSLLEIATISEFSLFS